MLGFIERYFLVVSVKILQGLRSISWDEIIGESDPISTQTRKFAAALCDQVVFVLLRGCLFGHDLESVLTDIVDWF